MSPKLVQPCIADDWGWAKRTPYWKPNVRWYHVIMWRTTINKNLEMLKITEQEAQDWFGLLVFNGTFSKNSLYRAIRVRNILRRASGQDKYAVR